MKPRPKVLVLDDDVMMCQLLGRTLERRGFRVACETSGLDALERLGAEDFDVVVSDLRMDGLDGLAFTQQVIARGLDVPVILMTGAAEVETAMGAVLQGAWDYLPKPIDAALLAASMHRACERRASLPAEDLPE